MKRFTHDEAQLLFDWLLPSREKLLSPRSVARAIGRTPRWVNQLAEEGALESFAHPDREQKRRMITRRSVLLLLAEHAESDPRDYLTRVHALLDDMTPDQLTSVIVEATKRRARI